MKSIRELFEEIPAKRAAGIVLALLGAIVSLINSLAARQEASVAQVVAEEAQADVDSANVALAVSGIEFDAYRDSVGREISGLKRRVATLEGHGQVRQVSVRRPGARPAPPAKPEGIIGWLKFWD